MIKDYYEILGVNTQATPEEIKDAYKKLAKAYHPDKHQGDPIYVEKFKSLQEAYSTLSDAQKRREYDMYIANQPKKQPSSQKTNTQENTNPQPQSNKLVDLPTLVEMYFQKRTLTVQTRKFYDGFLATPKKRYISWVKFILALLFIALVVILLNPSWGLLSH